MVKLMQTARNEFPSTEEARRGKVDVNYVYWNPEKMSTITFTVPLEEDTAENVRKILQERVAHAAAAGPTEIEI